MDSNSSAVPPTMVCQLLESWFKMIPLHEYWSCVMVAGMVLLMSAWGRRRFLINLGIFFSLLALAHVIFPGHFPVWITGNRDPVHIVLDRIIGTIFLMVAAQCYFVLTSADSTVEAALLLGFIIGPGLQLINIVYTYSNFGEKKSLTISHEGPSLGILGHILMISVALFYYVTTKDRGGYLEHPSKRNFHLHLNFLSFFLIGVLMYVFPASSITFLTSIKNVDVVHVFLARVCGAYFIGQGIVAAQATYFLRETDKISILFYHTVGLALQTSWLLYSALVYSEFKSLGMVVILCTKAVLFVNSLLGTEFGLVCKQCLVRDSLKTKSLGKPEEKNQ